MYGKVKVHLHDDLAQSVARAVLSAFGAKVKGSDNSNEISRKAYCTVHGTNLVALFMSKEMSR